MVGTQPIANPATMPESWRALYPFESRELSLDGLKYHYIDEGTGTPLLFVHGNPTWSFYYRRLISQFRETHRTVAVDHIGCGLSDKPSSYPYELGTHIDNLQQLLRSLDLQGVTLLCHDWGGAIGLGAATREPERFSRLVIFNTGAFPPPYVPFRIRMCRIPLLGTLGMRGLNLFARAALTMATERGLASDVAAGMIAPYNNWANRVAIDRFVKDIPRGPQDRTWQILEEIEENLRHLQHLPTKLIWGMKDWCFTPVCLDRFLEHFPEAEVVRLQTAGHYVIEDEPERVGEEVASFLASTGTTVG